ncbi:VOC family protein [Granulicella sp. L60]|uniref:VOC family protein n=1 Tax=Granulicella sp. L60 TaxID=1641866 RepID=UPI00131D6C31|nr:VOC family protein [Granulicella sp. L60]
MKKFLTLAALLLSTPLFAQTPPQRPNILGISHAGFFVSSLPAALDFWHGLLGYDDAYDLKNPDGTVSIAFIKINDHQHIELFNQKPPAGSGYLSHIAFIVSNAEQMRLYLASRGIPVDSKVGKGRTGERNFEIKDPDGTLVEFVEPQPDGMEAKNAGKFLPAARISDSIYHLGFLVGNSQKAMAFYGDILGFHEFWRGSSNGKELSWIDMRVPDGNDYVEFMLYRDLPPPNQRGVSEHVSLSVPNLATSITRLEASPAYKTYAKPLAPHTGVNGQRQVNLFDPDGTRIELMEPFTASGKPVPPSAAPPPN